MVENKQTVVIAEVSYMARKGLVHILEQLPYIDRVIELDETASLADQIANYKPNIIIINPNILGILSISQLRNTLEINHNTLLVGLITNLIDKQMVKLHFDVVISLFDSLEIIADKIKVLSNTKKPPPVETEELSDREKEILVTLIKGMSNKEIADYHHISIHTVITHRRNITRKLNIHSPSGLTIYAIVNKLVDINDIKL